MELRDALELLREMNRDSVAVYVLVPNGCVTPHETTAVWEVYGINHGNWMVPFGRLIASEATPEEACRAAYEQVMRPIQPR